MMHGRYIPQSVEFTKLGILPTLLRRDDDWGIIDHKSQYLTGHLGYGRPLLGRNSQWN